MVEDSQDTPLSTKGHSIFPSPKWTDIGTDVTKQWTLLVIPLINRYFKETPLLTKNVLFHSLMERYILEDCFRKNRLASIL